MNQNSPIAVPQKPTHPWLWLLVCAMLVLVMGYLRLVLFPDRHVPLAYGLPLLVCLVHRDLRLLYGMAIIFSLMVFFKMAFLIVDEPWYEMTVVCMQLMNIWLVAGVIHGLMVFTRRLEQKNVELEMSNAELEASNEELAAREEEIARQNAELQSQAEELEQQAEELRQHSEEVERQGVELQVANEELTRHEKGLHTLLDSARWLRSDLAEKDLMAAICQAAVEVMEENVSAAAIIQEKEGKVFLRGQWGFGVHGTTKREFDFKHSFTALVVEKGQTAFLPDLSARPDLEAPQPATGQPFRSVLASPIWVDGRVLGAVEIYSRQPREWSGNEFRVAEWLAAQTALAVQAVEHQRALEISRVEAEEASLQKSRFLAAVSHDVRTPANAISLLADLVERLADDPSAIAQVPPLLRNLKANARSLVELVSDVLDLARFDAGKLDLQLGEFTLQSLVDSQIRQFKPSADARGLSLYAVLPEEPLWVRSDRMKLSRVLANLVGNAIKFTEIGEVQIICRRDAGGGLELAVRDTGLGISAEQLPRIFDEFYQLRNPERDRNKGTGLGLAICRRLVDGLGCTLSVQSALGEGTTILLRLPRDLCIASPPAVQVKPDAFDGEDDDFSLQGMQVLLVEDHDDTRHAVAKLLAAHGAIVLQAPDCRAAFHILAEENPQVLLLDLMLPDQDGTEVLRFLRHHRPASLKCVLVVSGDVREARIEEVRRLGAQDLIPKPLTSERLLSAIRQHTLRCATKPIRPRPVGLTDRPLA